MHSKGNTQHGLQTFSSLPVQLPQDFFEAGSKDHMSWPIPHTTPVTLSSVSSCHLLGCCSCPARVALPRPCYSLCL